MGLSASEALLRRYRKEGAPAEWHPLMGLCYAASLAFAIPAAVFDAARITGTLTVRPADDDVTALMPSLAQALATIWPAAAVAGMESP